MKKVLVFPITLLFLTASTFLAGGCAVQKSDQDFALEKAQQIYQQKLAEGVDMTKGPCLTNELMPDWVLDIAHSPRQTVDNQPENQCSAFGEGKAHHFIELSEDGSLIKIY